MIKSLIIHTIILHILNFIQAITKDCSIKVICVQVTKIATALLEKCLD